MTQAATRVLIMAGDTDGNIGDRAIVLSTCDELRRQYPGVKIALLSSNPAVDRWDFGAEPLPRGPVGLIPLIKAALASDVVLIGGGGLFQDDSSLVKMPYWALRTAFLRCISRRVVGYSLGVGPLTWASSRWAARLAFACMHQVSVRDDPARAVSRSLTAKHVRCVPDPALMLVPASAEEADGLLRTAGIRLDGSPVVGVAVRRWFHQQSPLIPHKFAVKYRLRPIPGKRQCEQMIALLAEALQRLTETVGAQILFMPTYTVSHEADDTISREIMRRLPSRSTGIVQISDPRLYKAVTGVVDVMLCGRMHAAVLAAPMGTPVVGLSYNPKFDGFFTLIGSQATLLDIETFVTNGMVDELATLLERCIGSRTTVSAELGRLTESTRGFLRELLGSGETA